MASKILCLSLLLLTTSAGATQATPSFDQVAGEIQVRERTAHRDRQLTLRDIQQERARLTRTLRQLQSELASADKKLATEKALLDKLSRQRDTLKQDIGSRLASKEELDTVLLDFVGNFLARAEESPYSAQQPESLAKLRAFSANGHVFGMADVKTLFDLYFTDMRAGAEKIRYAGNMLDRGGNDIEADIIRLGHLAALHRSDTGTGYLLLSPASGRLVAGAEPPGGVQSNLDDYFDGETDRVFTDITGGAAIRQLARRDTMMDQLRSGGALVIPILLVGLVALALTVERLLFLARVRHNTDELMTRVTALVSRGDWETALRATAPHRDQPTGRVLIAGLQHRGENREIIESSLSEAILRETPRLERFLSALKVAAAVAPLLGLLGTVTGMINTFQVITTHGTGDPRLMAGGISEAMVTTQVGLAVAIPVMMIASFLGSRAHKLSQDMEEKGLALMGALLKWKNNDKQAAA
jgi:biopolymer transport protein ExbB